MTVTGEPYGEQVKRLRKELGWSIARTADECGVTKASVWAWEQGNRSFVSSDQTKTVRRALALLKRRLKYREKGQ